MNNMMSSIQIRLWGVTILVRLWECHGRDSLFLCFMKATPLPLHRRQGRCWNSKNLWSIEECLEQRATIKFLDGSWYHKGTRNGRLEFEQGPRIPGAHYWDMDDIATSKELFPEINPKGLRVMFPPKAMNIQSGSRSGGSDDQIVIYGRRGCLFTPRVWYILKTFGHSKVGLLQGSLEDWMEGGGPVETHPISYDIWARDILPTQDSCQQATRDASNSQLDKLDRILDQSDVLQHLYIGHDKNNSVKIIDTRGVDNYDKGHIPGAISIPYKTLVEPENALKLKSREELGQILKSHSLDTAEEIWLSCGSGVSVCHLAMALDECGYSKRPWIYDGSWNEWGSDPTTPKEVSKIG